jgi:uncharacterized protein
MIKHGAVFLVRFVSMAFRALSWRACRFHPTCSEYACEALGRFSFVRALRLSLSRLLRCQPFSRGGFDPLPEGRR